MTDEKPCPTQIASEKISGVNNQAAMERDKDVHDNDSRPFSRHGEDIYKIAQQIMDKHYCINISDLVTAYTRFIKNASRRDIINEIDRLEREKFFFDGHALTIYAVLENPIRKDILEIVSTSPGINFSRLRKKTNKGNYQLAWHLAILKKYAFIRSATIDGSLAFFPKASPQDHDVFNAFLSKAGLKEMLFLLQRVGKLKCKDIEFTLNLPHTTAFRRLQKLIERGFVKEVVDVEHDATWYELNPAWIEPIHAMRKN